MRFRNRQRSQLPELNLVPMMDVLLTVLTFFIIISMTLRGQQLSNVTLPQTDKIEQAETAGTAKEDVTLVVGLSTNKEILLDNQPVTVAQLSQKMRDFLAENPEGTVLLKADRGLTFSDVTQVLKTMRQVGGNRVSLAFDRTP